MAKGAYIGVGGVAKKIKKMYIGVSGVARKVKKAYIGVGGVAKLWWSGDAELSYYGTADNLNKARNALAATSVGNYAMFGGGYNSGALDIADFYNKSLTHTYTTRNTARSYLAATTIGNYALFGGGENNNGSPMGTIESFDTSLTRGTISGGIGASVSLPAATSTGTYALFGGGQLTSGASSVICALNSSLTKTSPTTLQVNRKLLAAASVGDYALFSGGYTNANAYSNAVQTYNSSLTRGTATGLSVARQYLAGTNVGNYALFGGGQGANQNMDYGYKNTVDAYDSALTRSIPTALSVVRYSLMAASINGYALFSGGVTPNSTMSPTYSSVTDAYNSSLTRTIPTGLSVPKYFGAATSIGNYALFGGGGSGIGPSNVVDVYQVA